MFIRLQISGNLDDGAIGY